MNRNNINKVFYYTMSNWSLMTSTQKNLIENSDYEPPSDSDWVRMTLGYGDTFPGELGGGIDWEAGIAFIDVFVVKDKGDVAGNEYAESLRTLFKDNEISYTEGLTTYTVDCRNVDIEPLGVDGDFNHTQVRVYFYNFVS